MATETVKSFMYKYSFGHYGGLWLLNGLEQTRLFSTNDFEKERFYHFVSNHTTATVALFIVFSM